MEYIKDCWKSFVKIHLHEFILEFEYFELDDESKIILRYTKYLIKYS